MAYREVGLQESNLDKKKRPDDVSRRVKPYRTPKIKTYGNIRDITQAVGRHGNTDNAGQRPSKTLV
jgi:hypothetical protein